MNICPWKNTLALFVGFGRQYSVAAIADATGIPERTVRSYLDGEHSPRWAHAVALLRVLPLSAADMVLAPAGLKAKPADDATADNWALLSRTGTVLAHLTEALADDGRIDHREEAEAEPAVREAYETMGQWLNRRNAKVKARA